ncbi:MAG TPA: hypothetical protein VFY04_10025 [Solirubrobacterales bacterium]|nr:hypothetical protein [Solirubrobacterales bacterium]
MADRTRFPIPRSGWERFLEVLDRPPRIPNGLRTLYSKPDAFE